MSELNRTPVQASIERVYWGGFRLGLALGFSVGLAAGIAIGFGVAR